MPIGRDGAGGIVSPGVLPVHSQAGCDARNPSVRLPNTVVQTMVRHEKPKRRRLPGAKDDSSYRVFMLVSFWVAVLGVVLLFFAPWWLGVTLIGLAAFGFVAGIIAGG